MLIKIILLKLYDLLGSPYRALGYITIILFYSITMIIRIFWSPIEYLMWFIGAVILLTSIYVHLPNNLSSRLRCIENKINQNKFEKALKEIDKILTKKLPKLKGNEKANIYLKCTGLKGVCLLKLGFIAEDSEKLEESITHNDETLKIGFRKNFAKVIPNSFINIGVAYLNLGRLENNEELLEKAIDNFEKALEYTKADDKKLFGWIHSQLGYTYELLSTYYSKEDNLKKSLEDFKYSYEIFSEKNILSDKFHANLSIATVSRKLYEINCDEEYKVQAIERLNQCIIYYSNSINMYIYKLYPQYYFFGKFGIGKSYFQLFKLNKSEENLKNCKEALTEALQFHTKEKFSYYNTEINNMLMDFNV